MELLIIIIVLGSIYAIYTIVSDSSKKKEARYEIDKRISDVDDFSATKTIKGVKGLYQFSIDETRKKLALFTKDNTIINEYKDILGVELIEDNETTLSRSLGRTVGGALAGGLLAGGAGSVVGGLSGNQTMKKKVSSVKVRITTRSIQNPYFEIDCFNSLTMCMGESSIKSDSLNGTVYYQPGRQHALEIVDLVKIIIDEVEHSQYLTSKESSVSIADELQKLSNLKESGILTIEEFEEQKKKLLTK